MNEYAALDPELLMHEPRIALSDEQDGLTFYREFAKRFSSLLKPEGKFFLEIGFAQQLSVEAIFSEFTVETRNDYSGVARILEGSNSKF